MKTFTATPEEFATGHASVKATDLFRNRNRLPRKPRAPLAKPANLDRQVGTITPEQFARGDAYAAGRRRFGHRGQKSAVIKPVAEEIVKALLKD